MWMNKRTRPSGSAWASGANPTVPFPATPCRPATSDTREARLTMETIHGSAAAAGHDDTTDQTNGIASSPSRTLAGQFPAGPARPPGRSSDATDRRTP